MRLSPLLLALVPCITGTLAAQQVVLNFDDLVGGLAPMPANYGGIADWGSWASSDLPDPNYPAFSGATKVLSVGLQQPIQFGQDLIFEGARVVTALTFSFELYYQGNLVHTTASVSPNTGGPAAWLPSGYTGLVDEMRYVSAVNVHGVDDFTYSFPASPVGTPYCGPAISNSTGVAGVMTAVGSDLAADNNLTLTASQLPPNQFCYFLNSQAQGFSPMPGGSQGNLCLSGAIGRYNAPGQVLNTGASGEASLVLDLGATPTPTGPAAVTAGETWNFQCWYRDANPLATSNFTDATSIAFS